MLCLAGLHDDSGLASRALTFIAVVCSKEESSILRGMAVADDVGGIACRFDMTVSTCRGQLVCVEDARPREGIASQIAAVFGTRLVIRVG